MIKEPTERQKKISFEEIRKKDSDEFMAAAKNISKIEDEEERRQRVEDLIDKAIKFFEKHQNEESFEGLMRKFLFLNMSSDEQDFDRAWTQENVNKLFNCICQYKRDENLDHPEYFITGILTTSKKIKKEDNTISDLVAKSIIQKIKAGEVIKPAMSYELRIWFQSIQMIDSDVRLEFLYTLLDNPGQTAGSVRSELVRSLADFNGALINQLIDSFNKKEFNLNSTLKLIDVLEIVCRQGFWEEWMMEAANQAKDILQYIYKQDNSFFVKLKMAGFIDRDLRFDNRKNSEQFFSDDREKLGKVPMPLGIVFEYNEKEEFLNNCCYSKISDKYGVIYNPKGQIDSFFQISGSGDNGEKKNLRVEDILRTENANWDNINKEDRENIINNYKSLIKPFFRNSIEEKFGIKLSSFNMREQIQFLNFISTRSEEEINSVVDFLKNGNNTNIATDRFKAFLSLEIDQSDGERILDIGKKLSNYTAQKVFQKIAELSDIVTKEQYEINKLFFKEDVEHKMSNLQPELLKKAHEIIIKFNNELIAGKAIDQERVDKLLEDLEQSKTEIILLASALKVAKENGETIDLENIKNFNFDINDFESELDEDTKKEMLTVAERNWRQNEKLKDVVMGGLGESLENSQNQKWYICQFQGKIASFVRFEKTDNGTLYAGSFNVDPEARGVGVGEEMMNRALIKEGENNILEATVSPRLLAGTCYVEKVGFVLDGYIADYHKTGEPLFSMRLDKEQNKSYAYRNEGKENKIDEEQIKKQCWTQENLDQIVGAETIVLKFDMENEFEKMNSAMQKLLVAKDDSGKNVEGQNLENKYVVTRYFQDNKEDKNNHTRYFVLEKI